jgi:hypothetical protein
MLDLVPSDGATIGNGRPEVHLGCVRGAARRPWSDIPSDFRDLLGLKPGLVLG